MIDEKRKKQASLNFRNYLQERLLKKETNILAKNRYIENSQLSLNTATDLMKSPLKPYLWIIVISYYSMFYIANAVLLHYGYKIQERIAHKVASDALIVLVLDKLRKELIEDY